MFAFLPSSEWHLPQHTAVFVVNFEFANELYATADHGLCFK
jgi:hypothetical protein